MIIKLVNVEWALLEKLFFSDLGVRHVASHKLFLMSINMFVFFWAILSFFLCFFKLKETPKVMWPLLVHTRARELPHLTTWCDFG